jgi:hypothetical protein
MSDYKHKTFSVKDSLIIIEPAQEISGFTLDSGYYKKAVDYKPSQMRRDGTIMEEVFDIDDVDTNNKFYYDGSFVWFDHDPSSNYITHFFELYFGSRGFKLPRDLGSSTDIVYFEPRIQGNPSFSKTGKDRIQGISVNGDASFILIDTNDDIFDPLDDLLEAYSFVNKRVEVYRYMSEEDTQDIVKLFKGTLTGWVIGRRSVTFNAKDYLRRLDNSVQKTEYTTSLFPNCDPNFIGKVQRVIYGETMVGCVNIDYVDDGATTSDNRVWRISVHPNFSVKEVWLRETKLTLTTHYTVNGNKDEITLVNNIEAGLGWDDINVGDIVYALVEGKMDGGSALMDNASDIVKDILYEVDFVDAELDLASFTTAKAANTYKIAMALPKKREDPRPTAKESIERINKSVFGFLSNDGDFKIKFNIYTVGSSKATVDVDRDMLSYDRVYDTTEMASKVVVEYEYSERFDNSTSQTKTDNDAKYLHLNDSSHTIESVLRQSADATSLLDDYSAFYAEEFKTESFSLKLQLADCQIGDFITVEGNLLEIQKIDRSITGSKVSARRT